MALYLQMDGVDDRVQLPSLTFTEIRIDATLTQTTAGGTNHYFVDARTGVTAYAIYGTTGNYSYSGFSIYENDVSKGFVAVTTGSRIVYKFTRAAATDDLTIFSRYTGTEALKGNIHNVKVYNGATLVAHYDMTTGTVQDQSGNGYHATLTGGTWLDDGTGGGDTGTDGSTVFDSKQSLYSDSAFSFDSLLRLYQDSSLQTDSKQTIYNDSALSFDTLQDLIDNTIGSTKFDIQTVLYADNQTTFDSKQSWYTEGVFETDLLQSFYEPAKAIIGTIRLKGSSTPSIHLKGNQTSPIHLKGGIQ